MKRGAFSVFVIAVLAIGITLAGCSKPPEAERESAKKAAEEAIAAGAEKYAASDLSAAKKVWDTAESQMKEKMYKEAKQSYIDAKASYERATLSVEAGKKAARDEANSALKATEETWLKLKDKAKKMEKKLKGNETWAAESKSIGEGLEKAKEMIENAPAEAKSKIDELQVTIDKWESSLKEMAKTSTKPDPKPKSKHRSKSHSKHASKHKKKK
jgi:hypothetical protein